MNDLNKKILVLNGASYGDAVTTLGVIVKDKAEFFAAPRTFKLVLFTGGEDVSPHLYGETSPKSLCYHNPKRDQEEKEVFDAAMRYAIPMFGICRGLQFLNVMNGGRLIHHLDGHTSTNHDMGTHVYKDPIRVNSLHHQMVIPPHNALIIGWSLQRLSEKYIGDKDEETVWAGPEVEAVFYPQTKCAGVQYHPEMLKSDTNAHRFSFNLAHNLAYMTVDAIISKYAGAKNALRLQNSKGSLHANSAG